MSRTWLTATVAIVSALLLTGCASLAREDFDTDEAARPAMISDIRFNADDIAATTAFAAIARRDMALGADKSLDILAISGGGAIGAYGAGVMVGWSETGRRPDFEVVTGVSTGALIAPFAFLGKSWDPQLTEVYTSGIASGILKSRGVGVLFSLSVYDSAGLQNLVDTYCTPKMMREIAREHAKGRRLLVATTNLDTQQTVIWNMGAIAAKGDAQSLQLFRDVLVASASIPGVFPPMMIKMKAADRREHGEMHVDGGVTAPFISIPEAMYSWSAPGGETLKGHLYILVNGKLDPNFTITRGGAITIMARSFDTMMKTTLRTYIAASRAFAERNGMDLQVAAVPEDTAADSLKFDKASMTTLFQLGHDEAKAGKAWSATRKPK